MIEKDRHPCFNPGSCAENGRIHLPVAKRCNVQCNFCNRKYDCVNESRPGVSSHLLSPGQALAYYLEAKKRMPFLSVVGIAGPGDPFANPGETMETLSLIREADPEVLLCVATNGLNLLPYVDRLAELEVSHVTVTVNAVDPEISSRIYSWVRHDRRVYHRKEGAAVLLENQREAVKKLKAHNLIVKINSIILPGINEHHIPKVAEEMAGLGVDYHNCLPYCPTPGSVFEDMKEPDEQMVRTLRGSSGRVLPQMEHCRRCRADSAGFLKEDRFLEMEGLMNSLSRGPLNPFDERKAVAVASQEGFLVNQHLGEAASLLVYAPDIQGRYTFLEERITPAAGGGEDRWNRLGNLLEDCHSLLVSGAGETPRRKLEKQGLRIYELEGMIDRALDILMENGDLGEMTRRDCTSCGTSCSGTAMGCL